MRLSVFPPEKASWFRPRAMTARAKLGASAQALHEESWQVCPMPHKTAASENVEEERPPFGRAPPPMWTRMYPTIFFIGQPASPHDRAPIGEADLKPVSSDQPGDLPTYLPLPVLSSANACDLQRTPA